MHRKIITVFIAVIGLFLVNQSFAKIDTKAYTIDTRTYPNWNSYPYNMIVKLITIRGGTCTGEFVAPNIIITASHCAKDSDYINVQTADGKKFKATKLYDTHFSFKNWESTNNANDYAIFIIYDKKYHSQKYFETSEEVKQYFNVMSLGFGALRILTDKELELIREILIDIIEKSVSDKTNATLISQTNDFIEKIENELVRQGKNPIYKDNYNLKAEKDCNILGLENDYLKTDCLVTEGNSGGSISKNLSGKHVIMGIFSAYSNRFGIDNININRNSYYVGAWHFRDEIQHNTKKESWQKYIIQVAKDKDDALGNIHARLVAEDIKKIIPAEYYNKYVYAKKEKGYLTVRIEIQPNTFEQMFGVFNFIKNKGLWLVPASNIECSESGDNINKFSPCSYLF